MTSGSRSRFSSTTPSSPSPPPLLPPSTLFWPNSMGLHWALVKDRSNEKKVEGWGKEEDVTDQGTDEPRTL